VQEEETTMLRYGYVAAALAALAVSPVTFGSTAPAAARSGVELGMLDCVIGPGTGFVIGSNKDVRCTFKPTNKKFGPEDYYGSVRKWGLDIGVTDSQVMRWAVLGPNADIYAPGGLAGDYVGATAEATAAVGAGANVLVGGTGNTFTLQPISVQSQTGLNVAVGVTSFELRGAED
jgi:hypothetical protein